MKSKNWILLAAALWLFIGMRLLARGLFLFSQSVEDPFGWSEQKAFACLALALLIGFIKGRFVLAKSAGRIAERLLGLSSPISFRDAYPLSYWIWILGMMGLGMSLRFFPLTFGIRASVDTTVGAALIFGSFAYLRFLKQPFSSNKKRSPTQF